MILTIIFLSILGICGLYYVFAAIINMIDDVIYDKEHEFQRKYYNAELLSDERIRIRQEADKFKSKTEKFHDLTIEVADSDSGWLPVMIFVGILFLVINLINGLDILISDSRAKGIRKVIWLIQRKSSLIQYLNSA